MITNHLDAIWELDNNSFFGSQDQCKCWIIGSDIGLYVCYGGHCKASPPSSLGMLRTSNVPVSPLFRCLWTLSLYITSLYIFFCFSIYTQPVMNKNKFTYMAFPLANIVGQEACTRKAGREIKKHPPPSGLETYAPHCWHPRLGIELTTLSSIGQGLSEESSSRSETTVSKYA